LFRFENADANSEEGGGFIDTNDLDTALLQMKVYWQEYMDRFVNARNQSSALSVPPIHTSFLPAVIQSNVYSRLGTDTSISLGVILPPGKGHIMVKNEPSDVLMIKEGVLSKITSETEDIMEYESKLWGFMNYDLVSGFNRYEMHPTKFTFELVEQYPVLFKGDSNVMCDENNFYSAVLVDTKLVEEDDLFFMDGFDTIMRNEMYTHVMSAQMVVSNETVGHATDVMIDNLWRADDDDVRIRAAVMDLQKNSLYMVENGFYAKTDSIPDFTVYSAYFDYINDSVPYQKLEITGSQGSTQYHSGFDPVEHFYTEQTVSIGGYVITITRTVKFSRQYSFDSVVLPNKRAKITYKDIVTRTITTTFRIVGKGNSIGPAELSELVVSMSCTSDMTMKDYTELPNVVTNSTGFTATYEFVVPEVRVFVNESVEVDCSQSGSHKIGDINYSCWINNMDVFVLYNIDTPNRTESKQYFHIRTKLVKLPRVQYVHRPFSFFTNSISDIELGMLSAITLLGIKMETIDWDVHSLEQRLERVERLTNPNIFTYAIGAASTASMFVPSFRASLILSGVTVAATMAEAAVQGRYVEAGIQGLIVAGLGIKASRAKYNTTTVELTDDISGSTGRLLKHNEEVRKKWADIPGGPGYTPNGTLFENVSMLKPAVHITATPIQQLPGSRYIAEAINGSLAPIPSYITKKYMVPEHHDVHVTQSYTLDDGTIVGGHIKSGISTGALNRNGDFGSSGSTIVGGTVAMPGAAVLIKVYDSEGNGKPLKLRDIYGENESDAFLEKKAVLVMSGANINKINSYNSLWELDTDYPKSIEHYQNSLDLKMQNKPASMISSDYVNMAEGEFADLVTYLRSPPFRSNWEYNIPRRTCKQFALGLKRMLVKGVQDPSVLPFPYVRKVKYSAEPYSKTQFGDMMRRMYHDILGNE
jgi:hypothetical protein